MHAFKKKYYFLIQSIKDIDLSTIKKYKKIIIIYRNFGVKDKKSELIKFRMKCKLRLIKFFVANNIYLATLLKADGIYVSAHNKSLKFLNYKKSTFDIIGSAHNFKEIELKKRQGCKKILLSRLFLVDYKNKEKTLGVIKFNRYSLYIPNILVPLGGIKISNLKKMKCVNSEGLALLSEIKKKPAKIINRLF